MRNLDALNDMVKGEDLNVYRALLNLFELTALCQIQDGSELGFIRLLKDIYITLQNA